MVATASSATSKSEDSTAEADWANCVETLRRLGVGKARECVQEARDNRATPGDVLAVVDHFTRQPGAWGLGALADRVGKCAPGLAPDAAWVPKSLRLVRVAKGAETAVDRSANEDFECMRLVRNGKREGRSEAEIEGVLSKAGLAAASARMGWREVNS